MENGNTKSTLIHIAALTMTFTVALARTAPAQDVTPPPVPAGLEVEAGNEAFLVGHARGTQNYVCLPSASLGRVAWSLFTPEATLFDDLDAQLTTHFFGPNPDEGGIVRAIWQDSRDTSSVAARAIAQFVDPPFVEAGAIPWLLLQAVGVEAGPTGGRTLSTTTFIHRVNTSGGAAPSTGCATPTDIGSKRFVPYSADYFFYRRQGR